MTEKTPGTPEVPNLDSEQVQTKNAIQNSQTLEINVRKDIAHIALGVIFFFMSGLGFWQSTFDDTSTKPKSGRIKQMEDLIGETGSELLIGATCIGIGLFWIWSRPNSKIGLRIQEKINRYNASATRTCDPSPNSDLPDSSSIVGLATSDPTTPTCDLRPNSELNDSPSIVGLATQSDFHSLQPETTAKRPFRLIAPYKVLRIIAMASISATFFLGPFFGYLSFGYKTYTMQGTTTLCHRPIDLLCGFALGLASVAHLYATIYFLFIKKDRVLKKMEDDVRPVLMLFSVPFSFLFFSLPGWFMFSQGNCNWIRIDYDGVTSGFFITARSIRFDQIKEVYFANEGATADFYLNSSEKVTWNGTIINVGKELQQMLAKKEIPVRGFGFANR